MKQGTEITAKVDCTIVPATGRKVSIKVGQQFVVTSPEYKNAGGCMIDRKSSAKINTGYYFSLDQIKEIFHA